MTNNIPALIPSTFESIVMEVCLLLANNVGQVVTREELLNTVWAGRYGGDESLSRAVSELRKALSQVLGADTKFITTVPKRGYRLEKIAFQPSNQVQKTVICTISKTI